MDGVAVVGDVMLEVLLLVEKGMTLAGLGVDGVFSAVSELGN